MKKNARMAFFCFLAIIFASGSILAEDRSGIDRKLIVGTKEAPPFAMKTPDGDWTGISIDLWRWIAGELNLTFEFREATLKQLIDETVDGTLDVAVAALTITSEREKILDFTHPFYTSSLGIAVSTKPGNPWVAVLKRFLSGAFLKVAATLTVLLLGVGVLIWWFERKKNPQQFGGSAARGIGSGFWWSAVTMTTVGYGDKAPVTFWGRLIALVWMFVAIIIISGFTAAITSSLTVTQLEPSVRGPKDLPNVRVGTARDTSSSSYLDDRRISFQPFDTPLSGLRAITEGNLDSFVYDRPLLRYLINRDFKGVLDVLPDTLVKQDYGIALPEGSLLREPINRILLKKIDEPAWQDLLHKYLG